MIGKIREGGEGGRVMRVVGEGREREVGEQNTVLVYVSLCFTLPSSLPLPTYSHLFPPVHFPSSPPLLLHSFYFCPLHPLLYYKFHLEAVKQSYAIKYQSSTEICAASPGGYYVNSEQRVSAIDILSLRCTTPISGFQLLV